MKYERHTQEQWDHKRREVHGNRYECLDEYDGILTKLTFVCKEHGIFPQIPHDHLSGRGCKKCGYIRTGISRTIWTFVRCQKEAQNYETRKAFKDRSNNAYAAAVRNGWIDDICKHMIRLCPSAYTFGECQEEASKYQTRSAFQKGSPGKYASALRKGWLKKICEHMIRIGNLRNRCVYAVEFPDNHVYVGITDNHLRREKEHIGESKFYKKSSVYKYIIKTGLIPIFKKLTDYFPDIEVESNEKWWQQKYIREEWIPLFDIVKAGLLGGSIRKWTVEKLIEESLQYNSRSEFENGSGSAYQTARKLNILDKICSHMTRPESNCNIPVIAIKDNKIAKFKSVTEAGSILKIKRNNISNVLNGWAKTSDGYKFKYVA